MWSRSCCSTCNGLDLCLGHMSLISQYNEKEEDDDERCEDWKNKKKGRFGIIRTNWCVWLHGRCGALSQAQMKISLNIHNLLLVMFSAKFRRLGHQIYELFIFEKILLVYSSFNKSWNRVPSIFPWSWDASILLSLSVKNFLFLVISVFLARWTICL